MEHNIAPDYYIKDEKRVSRYWGFNIDKVEELKNAKFVCEVAVRLKNGGWSESPVAIFWQETPPDPTYSNYFGLLMQGDTLYITSGQSAVEDGLTAIVASNGDLVYSAYRHDFRYSPDQSVWIDGGRDYVRHGGAPDGFVILKFVKDKLVIEEAVNNDL